MASAHVFTGVVLVRRWGQLRKRFFKMVSVVKYTIQQQAEHYIYSAYMQGNYSAESATVRSGGAKSHPNIGHARKKSYLKFVSVRGVLYGYLGV
jgi:hypothetical protein